MSSTATIQPPATGNTISPPSFIYEKCHTQSIFTCNICCEISMDPVVTPCDHIFCRNCIHQSLHRNRFCPNDRAPLQVSQLKELCGISKRIWSQTPVKCTECQSWTGTLQSYITEHGSSCVNAQKRIQELVEKLKEAETKLHMNTNLLQGQIQALEKQLNAALEAQNKATSQAGPIDRNQNQAKRPYEHSPRFKSMDANPFGPFGNQQQQQQMQHEIHSSHSQQPNIAFGSSNTIFTAPSNNPTFGINITGTSAPPSTWNYQSNGVVSGFNVQFQMGVAGRRIIRARRPTSTAHRRPTST
jgi:Zinc finger, C3HC4 type (RING finger)